MTSLNLEVGQGSISMNSIGIEGMALSRLPTCIYFVWFSFGLRPRSLRSLPGQSYAPFVHLPILQSSASYGHAGCAFTHRAPLLGSQARRFPHRNAYDSLGSPLPPSAPLNAPLRSLRPSLRRKLLARATSHFGSLLRWSASATLTPQAVSGYPTTSVTPVRVMFSACVALSRAAMLRPALHLRHGRSTPCVLHCPCSQAARGQ